ncbi:MAG: cob(I)yrinic acid a,c-diamide adenosyltransferase [Muribaculaceae bacterium]|nr:cob(I)yrinic acid a,c-diamide adenosyltransferase [Muribaculaceae bacterium]
MKIYTKGGDKGTTSLVGGTRVCKNCAKIEAYGTIDELNSFIGDLLTVLNSAPDAELLNKVQNWLFNAGSILASEEAYVAKMPQVTEEQISQVESRIDEIDSLLPKHNKFILPCGVPSATKAHICRTVARRAERCICALSAEEPVSENIYKLINRLSDYLFVLARYCNNIENKEEIFWDNHC